MTLQFLNSFLKFLFLLTPFFALSMFLSMTQGYGKKQKQLLAIRVGLSALCICLIFFYFGRWLFDALGITIDSFRIGGGILLFLSAVGLVNSNVADKKNPDDEQEINIKAREESLMNLAVVPLALPIIVGPGTTAALLISGAEAVTIQSKAINTAGMTAALLSLTIMLFIASWLEEKFGRNVIVVLSKITGLVLAAMAAQMIFTGIRAFLIDPLIR